MTESETATPMTTALAVYRGIAVYRPPWHRRLLPHLVRAGLWLAGLTPVRLLLAGSVVGAGVSLAVLLTSAPCVLLLVPVVLQRWLKRRADTSLGSARFAEAEADLRPATLLDAGPGLVAGRVRAPRPPLWRAAAGLLDPRVPSREAVDRAKWFVGQGWWWYPVRLNTSPHTAIFSPPGGGKSTGYGIPHLLDCPDSAVVVDMKAELLGATGRHRQERFGHRVVTLDPMGGGRDALDPLSLVDPDADDCVDRIRSLAEAIIVRTGEEKDRFWDDSAEVILTAMMLAVVLFGRVVSLQAVRHLLTDRKLMQEAITELEVCDRFDGIAARYGRQLRQFRGDTRASVMATVGRHLRMLDTPSVQEATGRTTFDPEELVTGRMSVYIVIAPAYQRSHAGLIRLWLTTLVGVVVRHGPQEGIRVQVVIDEAGALSKLPVLDDCLNRLRGYGIRLVLMYQSVAQLKECWGSPDLLLASCSSIFMGINDAQTCELVSAATGESTVAVYGTSRNGGGGWSGSQLGQESWSRSWGWGDSVGLQQRRLLTAGEVRTLNPRLALVFVPSLPPLCVYVPRSYDRPAGPGGLLGRLGLRAAAVAMFWLTTGLAVQLAGPRTEVRRGGAEARVAPAGAGGRRPVLRDGRPADRPGVEAPDGPRRARGVEQPVPRGERVRHGPGGARTGAAAGQAGQGQEPQGDGVREVAGEKGRARPR